MTHHFEILVEEPSMEAFLRGVLPRLVPPERTFEIYPFQGKQDLLGKLENRLRGYAKWLPADWRIVVLVDQDDDDCRQLKQHMDQIASGVGLRTRSCSALSWQIVNRIAIEELEAWYFGDWEAVRAAYPRVSSTAPQKQKYRQSDAISGGTWEAFERILQRHGYFKGGLPKIEVARTLGRHLNPIRCCSPSFTRFRDVILQAVQATGECT